MNLYLLRHGPAAEPDDPRYRQDRDRPLTEEGFDKMRRAARGMARLELAFDLVIASPYLRAAQTAEVVVSALSPAPPLETSVALVPEGDPGPLFTALAAREPAPQSVLLVGHEPFMSDLISRLLTGGPGLPVEMKKGALCKILLGRWVPRTGAGVPRGALVWLATSKHLGLGR